VTGQWLLQILDEETDKIRQKFGDKYSSTKFDAAKAAFATNVTGEKLDDFLTTLLYDDIVTTTQQARL
jgi:malate synthase